MHFLLLLLPAPSQIRTCATSSNAPIPAIFHHPDALTDAVDGCVHAGHHCQLLR
jgi:hypothetical protein